VEVLTLHSWTPQARPGAPQCNVAHHKAIAQTNTVVEIVKILHILLMQILVIDEAMHCDL
jgi:hypothetical protein